MANFKFSPFFILALLFISFTLTQAIRQEPFSKSQNFATEIPAEVEIQSENCDGDGKEDCLRRRTLEAHLDYIYTQKHNP
ncbi:phytosulfokines-like [Mercurialis annua]|uniref:phytosulfokines-like n=1 Tax=Mercurialis annua TaxID=3986 RepID=UPI002160DF4B|nr:phytosulfokines-like [Mercurialis annua]